MVVRLILGFLGLFHLANGLEMLLAPDQWAAIVVHLTAPDRLHYHFIADIGFAFAASGTGMLVGATRRGSANGVWGLAGAVWPLLHGLFHLKEWIADGPPPMPGLLTEGVGVILVGFVGIWLAWVRYRKGAA